MGFRTENYDMHIMLRCFHLLENREHLLKNIIMLDGKEYGIVSQDSSLKTLKWNFTSIYKQ